MSPPNEKPTFGATVERTSSLPRYQANDSTDSLLAVPPPAKNRYSGLNEPFYNAGNPFSAFYTHPSTRTSLEQIRNASQTHLPLSEKTDLESGLPLKSQRSRLGLNNIYDEKSGRTQVSTAAFSRNGSVDIPSLAHIESSVWPTKKELMEKAKILKKEESRKNWDCLGRLSKKNRMIVRGLIVLVVVAAAVGLGVGISIAVGGSVYAGDGQQSTIPKDS